MSSHITVSRYHDISCGHRVVGHEGKCALLHGHNYRVHFTIRAPRLDSIGRVVDFSVIRTTLCQWLEDNWDHKFLAWDMDEELQSIQNRSTNGILNDSLVWIPFNPTAEAMAEYLVIEIAPRILPKEVELAEVRIEETRKCSVTFRRNP